MLATGSTDWHCPLTVVLKPEKLLRMREILKQCHQARLIGHYVPLKLVQSILMSFYEGDFLFNLQAQDFIIQQYVNYPNKQNLHCLF